ncbi:hypothetical protein [Spirosoma rhododendri]|uniref:Uncharacterized protein n=1 Tax=Spirosoma rhododendri TaxID=2728024 RepID=A0A7L5DN41_9BACT|nr:hypothetical protein [Spirosoma rhododendri]QJD78901.1 hypothetical protein HH216_11040 [Spirosoma rhododendri]
MQQFSTLTINLTNQQIESSLVKIKAGLAKYLAIQKRFNELEGQPIHSDDNFKKSVNGFYRIRQKPATWYATFYKLLDDSRSTKPDFATVLHELSKATNRFEVSFASKLLATIDPQMPVIDSVVLKYLNVKIPARKGENYQERHDAVCALHSAMSRCYMDYLASEQGQRLITQFRQTYPKADISTVKMLDLVLWQTR